mmetsp:Transcript_2235/g.2683  ORF Transcript_2235/g.2683 Transcript_2235/m.2683 type:complete len:434 (-) Transcript_2235:599-1900(-)
MSESESQVIESLATKCMKTIATNIERYPAETLGSILCEMEWENVVRLKYQMTAPQYQIQKRVGSNLLSDGRKFPVLNEKFIKDFEERNPHLAKSNVIDDLVWKDNVDFKFRKGGHSRPALFNEPWQMQIRKLKSISEELTGLVEDDNIENSKQVIRRILKELKVTPMTVDLLSQTGIGKVLKKTIRKIRQSQAVQETSPGILTQFEFLLDQWKQVAGFSNSNTNEKNNESLACILGKRKETSDARHRKDVNTIKECDQWRDMYDALVKREQNLRNAHGEKMRKIRENLEVGRSKIGTAKTKQKHRSLDSKTRGINVNGNITAPSKVNVLRQGCKERRILIEGNGSLSKSHIAINTSFALSSRNKPSFASSVANNTARKRRSSQVRPTNAPASKAPKIVGVARSMVKREIVLGDGKKLRLPKGMQSTRKTSNRK